VTPGDGSGDEATPPSHRAGWIAVLPSSLMANQPGPLAPEGQAATSASQRPGGTLDTQQRGLSPTWGWRRAGELSLGVRPATVSAGDLARTRVSTGAALLQRACLHGASQTRCPELMGNAPFRWNRYPALRLSVAAPLQIRLQPPLLVTCTGLPELAPRDSQTTAATGSDRGLAAQRPARVCGRVCSWKGCSTAR